jgi:DNA polymerase III subunit epsilon
VLVPVPSVEQRVVDRDTAIEAVHEIVQSKPCFLDLETTGVDDLAEIVSIGVVDADGAIWLDTLIKPERSIPQGATRVHGISNSHVKDAPKFPFVYEHLCELIKHFGSVVIYNADFDMRILDQVCRQHGLDVFSGRVHAHCAMRLYSMYRGEWNSKYDNYTWHKLTDAIQHIGLKAAEDAHSAVADAEMTRQLVLYIDMQHRESSEASADSSDNVYEAIDAVELQRILMLALGMPDGPYSARDRASPSGVYWIHAAMLERPIAGVVDNKESYAEYFAALSPDTVRSLILEVLDLRAKALPCECEAIDE